MLSQGASTIADTRLGPIQVTKIHLGAAEIWSNGPALSAYDLLVQSYGPTVQLHDSLTNTGPLPTYDSAVMGLGAQRYYPGDEIIV